MYKLSPELFALEVNVNWGISSQPFSTLFTPKQRNVEVLPSVTFCLQKFYLFPLTSIYLKTYLKSIVRTVFIGPNGLGSKTLSHCG